MVMIDRLECIAGTKATGTLEILPGNIFVKDGLFTESGMLEAMAQTSAARTGWMMHSRAGDESPGIPVGVIGAIKDFRLFFYPEPGDVLETEIEVVHEFMNASVVHGRVRVGGKMASQAELKIFLTE